MINYAKQGDLVVASGNNWQYEQAGDLVVFTQFGKVPSLRTIKTMIKLLGKASADCTHQGGSIDGDGSK